MAEAAPPAAPPPLYSAKYHETLTYLPEEPEPTMEGWLCKQQAESGKFKQRWFVLHQNYLFYFKNASEDTPRGSIPLEECEVLVGGADNEPGVFQLRHRDNFEYFLRVDGGAEELEEWMEAIKYSKYSGIQETYTHLESMHAKSTQRNLENKAALQQLRDENAELQAAKQRMAGGAGGAEAERLAAQLAQATRQRDGALRKLQEAGGRADTTAADFELGQHDFRVLVFRDRHDNSHVVGELFLAPDATLEEIRDILHRDLGQAPPLRLTLQGTTLLPAPGESDQVVSELFPAQYGGYVVISMDQQADPSVYLGSPAPRERAEPQRPAGAGQPAPAPAPEPVSQRPLPPPEEEYLPQEESLPQDAQRAAPGGPGLQIPVYWTERGQKADLERDRRGTVVVVPGMLIADVRLSVEEQNLHDGQPYILKKRKVPLTSRQNKKPADQVFKSESDILILEEE